MVQSNPDKTSRLRFHLPNFLNMLWILSVFHLIICLTCCPHSESSVSTEEPSEPQTERVTPDLCRLLEPEAGKSNLVGPFVDLDVPLSLMLSLIVFNIALSNLSSSYKSLSPVYTFPTTAFISVP